MLQFQKDFLYVLIFVCKYFFKFKIYYTMLLKTNKCIKKIEFLSALEKIKTSLKIYKNVF